MRKLLLNPLNAKLNPICHLLALLGDHHILHVSRIGVNEQRFLMYVPNRYIKGLIYLCVLYTTLGAKRYFKGPVVFGIMDLTYYET